MPDALKPLLAWLARAVSGGGLWWGVGVSLGMAVASLAVAAVVIASWSPDRFKHARGAAPPVSASLPLRVLGRVGKNLAGAVLLVVGAVMALPGVPGQGFLTMIIGLTLLDFPGKLALERRLVSRPWVLRQLNRLRVRLRRPPLELD